MEVVEGVAKYYIIPLFGIPGEALYVCVFICLILLCYLLPRRVSGKSRRLVLLLYIIIGCLGVVFSATLSAIKVETTIIDDKVSYDMMFTSSPFTVFALNIVFLVLSKRIYFTHSGLAKSLGIQERVQRGYIFLCLTIGQIIRIILLRQFFFNTYHLLEESALASGLEPTFEYDECISYFLWEIALLIVPIIAVIYYLLVKAFAEKVTKLRLMYLKSRVSDKYRQL